MINHSPKFNNAFLTQVEIFLGDYLYISTMKTIKNCIMKKNTSIIALIIIYENNGKDTKTVYKVLICVVYTLIENYVCIEYLSCQSKTLCDISSNSIFKETSLNLLLDIGIPELLLNIVSCSGFMNKSNSTVILNFRPFMIDNYLSKTFFII